MLRNVPGLRYLCKLRGSAYSLSILKTTEYEGWQSILGLTRLGVEELGLGPPLGPPNWFGGVGLLSPPEKEKPFITSTSNISAPQSDLISECLHDTNVYVSSTLCFANVVACGRDQTPMFTVNPHSDMVISV